MTSCKTVEDLDFKLNVRGQISPYDKHNPTPILHILHILVFDLLERNLAQRLPRSWETFTPMLACLTLFVHELETRTDKRANRHTGTTRIVAY